MPRRSGPGRRAERLIVVSNRAPVEVEHADGGMRVRRTVGGLAIALDDVLRSRSGVWIAWAGPDAPEILRPSVTGLGYSIRTAQLGAEEVAHFYGGFANQVLWPLCHGFPERCRFESAFWPAYEKANARSRASSAPDRGGRSRLGERLPPLPRAGIAPRGRPQRPHRHVLALPFPPTSSGSARGAPICSPGCWAPT
jgi:hypothetical protein